MPLELLIDREHARELAERGETEVAHADTPLGSMHVVIVVGDEPQPEPERESWPRVPTIPYG
jgi:hypothetical protein